MLQTSTTGVSSVPDSSVIYGAYYSLAADNLRHLFRIVGTVAVQEPANIISGLGAIESRTLWSEEALETVCDLSYLRWDFRLHGSDVRSGSEGSWIRTSRFSGGDSRYLASPSEDGRG